MEKQNRPLIVGLTGAFGSGKSTAAEFFKSKGFKKIALVSFLEEEARKRDFKQITRKILQDIGNQWREKFGRNILAKKALNFLAGEKGIVDGIRNIGETEELRKNSKFVLVGIVADRKIRFERLRKLKRREDLTWDLFTKLDYRDLGIGEEKTGLQTACCLALADVFINNNGKLEEFEEKLKNFLNNYG